MIKVIIKEEKKTIVQLTVSGHAESDEHGKDLICAGVSTVSVGVLNTLDAYGFLDNKLGMITMRDGYIDIVVSKSNREIQVILETLKITLITLQNDYPEYIMITSVEV